MALSIRSAGTKGVLQFAVPLLLDIDEAAEEEQVVEHIKDRLDITAWYSLCSIYPSKSLQDASVSSVKTALGCESRSLGPGHVFLRCRKVAKLCVHKVQCFILLAWNWLEGIA